MIKNTMAIKLPRRVEKYLQTAGEQIKLARKRRHLSLATIAARAQCSELTVIRVEKGAPTVAMGIYARVLYALGLDEDILLLAGNDRTGQALIEAEILARGEKNHHQMDEEDVFD